MCCLVAKLCPTLWDSKNCSSWSSSAHRISQARILIAIFQSLSHVWLFATPWTVAWQASLFFTISQSLLKLMSIELVMPSNHLILCQPLLLQPLTFSSIRVFSMSQFFPSGGQSIGASASVFLMNIQGWFLLGLTGLISLQSRGLCRQSNVSVF